MAEVPHGIPEVLYNFPVLTGQSLYKYDLTHIILHAGTTDYKHFIEEHSLSEVRDLYHEEATMVCPLYQSIADYILLQHNLHPPRSFEEAFNVYSLLINTNYTITCRELIMIMMKQRHCVRSSI